MGVPDMENLALPPMRKRQRLSLKASRQKVESTPPTENDSNNATSPDSSASRETVSPSCVESGSSVFSSDSSREARVPAVASLENFGNTCFMNSVLQVLRYTPGFLDSLAHLSQDITASEKILRKKKASEETPTFEEENSKKCWKVVKNVYKVYRDQCLLEDRYEEVASDDVMSMAVKPSKILNSIRELNPMFEGNYQHDAQEFLRCLLCYLQDAEKEVQKFYCLLPPRFTPKAATLNPIMQKFLQAVKRETTATVTSHVTSSNTTTTSAKTDSEKVKHNLFPKPDVNEVKTETAKSPSKFFDTPQLGDTASVVIDEQSLNCHPTGAMSTPQASLTADLPDGFKVDIGELATVVMSSSKPPARSRATARRGRKFHPYQGSKSPDKQARPANGPKGNKIDCSIDSSQPSITQMFKTYGSKKRLGMRGPVVSKSEELFDAIRSSGEKTLEADVGKAKGSSDNLAIVTSKSEPKLNTEPLAMLGDETRLSKNDGTQLSPEKQTTNSNDIKVAETKSSNDDFPANQITSFQDMFASFLTSSPYSDQDDSPTMNSDSDNEDIVMQKRIAKQIHQSPRRSPRKISSCETLASPRKLDFRSKLSLTSKSDTFLTQLSQKRSNSISTLDMLDGQPGNNMKDLSSTSLDTDVDTSPVNSVGLLPVVKLEKCDHVFDEDSTSVDADYATQCLTPCKRSPGDDWTSRNYLKQRSLLTQLDMSSEKDLQRALDEMYNSPVKSRSLCDLIERLFQGTMMLRTRCLQCESSKERKEDFHDVSVPVRLEKADSDDEDEDEVKPGLMALIEASTEVEKLLEENKYYCDSCQIYAEAERSVHYDTLPDILTLHLKRFSADLGKGGYISKINDAVDIPISLPCLRYRCPKLCMRPDHKYTLYAVVTHSGVTLSAGHYLAYVRSLPKKKQVEESLFPIKTQPTVTKKTIPSNTKPLPEDKGQSAESEKSDKKMATTRRKAGISPKLPSRFKDNAVTDTKVKANVNNNARKTKVDIAEALAPSKRFKEGEWFECDDETVRVFDEHDFVDLLSGKDGALLGTPYLLFYHKATLC